MADLYVPLDVNAPDDPKIVAAGDAAELVFYRSLCLAKRLWSDGFIARGHVARLGGTDVVAAALVATGLWTEVDGGYRIVAFLKRNASREMVEASRKADADRKAKWRAERDADLEAATEVSHGTPASRKRRATRSEVKCSEVKKTLSLEFEDWWKGYPRKVDKAKARDQFEKRRAEGTALETLTSARDAYAASINGTEPRFIQLGATFLGPKGRWQDDWAEARATPDDWMNPR